GFVFTALVDAEAAVDERQSTGAVRRAALTHDRCQVLVRQLHHVGKLIEADAAALTEQRVVVATVEVHAPPGKLIEILLALLRGHDQTTVAHEAGRKLLIEQERELPDFPALEHV